MDPSTDPGVPTPPVEPAQDPSTGKEPVTNTDGQTVPFSRFQEVNDKAKAAEERAIRIEQELAALREQQKTPVDDDIEPDTFEIIRKSATKLGLVSKEELDAREAQIQVRSDLSELSSKYKDSGVPFDGQKIIDYAKANGMPITSKKSLDAIYKEMNYDNIIEAQRKAAVAAFQEGAKSGGEKPGSKGAQPPSEPKPTSLRDRVKLAREKLSISV